MANPIRRLVQLVLDRAAASRTEADAKKSLSGVEGALNRLKSLAQQVGATIAAAIGVRALLRFGEEAVKSAADAEKIWGNLRGTIQALGGDFAGMRKELEATAAAFQDATIHSDEDYAQGLTRMISLTGDIEKSIANMGLAANVASQFFDGDLTPAIELVAKVSQGNVTMLQRMGITVDSAREGLDVLAQRSLGAAARQTETLSGQLRQLNNEWDNFKEALGGAIIAGNNSEGMLRKLILSVQSLTRYVEDNREVIAVEAVQAFHALVIVVDGAYRGIRGLGELFAGFFQLAIGTTVGAVALLTEGFLGLLNVVTFLPRKIVGDLLGGGLDPLGAKIDAATAKVAALRKEMGEFMKSGVGWMGDAAGLFGNRSMTAQLLLGDVGSPGRKKGKLPGSPSGVVVSEKPADPTKPKEIVDPIGESFAKLSTAMRVAQGMSQLLGKDFDLQGAQADALKNHLQELLAAGFSPMDPYIVAVSERLQSLAKHEDKVGEITKQLAQALAVIPTEAAAFGDSFDALGAQASALETAISSLALEGFDKSNPIMAGYIEQLGKVYKAQGLAKEQAEDYATAVSNLSSLIAGAVGGDLKEVAKAKAKENALLAAEQLAMGIVASLSLFGAVKAGKHYAAAAKFSAIAVAWGGLGASLSSGGGGGGSGGLAGGQGASGAASQAAQAPKEEVHIYLTGPGFDAINPQVQRVVWGAIEQARERVGPNAKIAVVRRP